MHKFGFLLACLPVKSYLQRMQASVVQNRSCLFGESREASLGQSVANRHLSINPSFNELKVLAKLLLAFKVAAVFAPSVGESSFIGLRQSSSTEQHANGRHGSLPGKGMADVIGLGARLSVVNPSLAASQAVTLGRADYLGTRILSTSMSSVTAGSDDKNVKGSAGEPVKVDIAKLVARCVELGEQAGAKMREVQARPSLDIVDKGGEQNTQGEYVADVQTAADREVEEFCLAALSAEFPGVVVVAEESASEAVAKQASPEQVVEGLSFPSALAALAAPWPEELRSVEASRIIVYIDPLDGTGEFVKGNLLPVTNLIGVAVDGVPVAGVINQPWAPGLPSGRTIWGGPGAGVHGITQFEGDPSRFICTNRVVRSDREAESLSALGVTPEQDAQRVSATGFNLLCVLEGTCALFVLARHGTKKWDSCAGEALLDAVGGIVTDAVGRRYRYGSEPNVHMNLCGLLAARNQSLHAKVATTIRQAVAPWPLNVEDASVIMSS